MIYTSMEDIEPVPQTAWILARDDISGKERNVLLPLVSYHFSDKHWEDGFRLDLTVADYDAGFYEVGGVRIEARKEDIRESLTSHETEILSQAGWIRKRTGLSNSSGMVRFMRRMGCCAEI